MRFRVLGLELWLGLRLPCVRRSSCKPQTINHQLEQATVFKIKNVFVILYTYTVMFLIPFRFILGTSAVLTSRSIT